MSRFSSRRLQRSDLNLQPSDVEYQPARLATFYKIYSDPGYLSARQVLNDTADAFKQGDEIPQVEYNEYDNRTWKAVWRSLEPLIEKNAAQPYLDQLHQLQDSGCWNSDRLPQARQIDQYMFKKTGFNLHPVSGLVNPRVFLAGLALRVCYYSLFVRHASMPSFCPEPDCIHQLIGHTPMLCDERFADVSQQFGIASLTASDEEIQQLMRVYWYCFEFGLCKQDGDMKAFGAALLSSQDELLRAFSANAPLQPFDPSVASGRDYPITEHQSVYYYSPSMSEMMTSMLNYVKSMQKSHQPVELELATGMSMHS